MSGSQLVGSENYSHSSLHRSVLHYGFLIEDVQQGVPLQLDPLDVRFTHSEISARIRDGRWIDQTIETVPDGLIAASHILPCTLVRWGSGMYSLYNRKLFVFRVLGVMGHINVLTSMQARTHVHEECRSGPVVLFVFNEAELTTYMAVALLLKQKSHEQSNVH